MKSRVTLSIQRLSQAEFIQFMTSTLDVLADYNQQHPDFFIHSLTQRLAKDLPKMKQALKQKQGSDLTKELAQRVKIRNEDYRSLLAGIKGYQNTRHVAKAEAYRLLSSLCQQCKVTAQQNIQESFALITVLLDRLEEESYQEAVQLLHLEDGVAYLKESQAQAYQIFLQRFQEAGSRLRINSQPIRKQMTQQYTLLYNHLINLNEIEPGSTTSPLLVQLNSIRQTYAKYNLPKGNQVEKEKEQSPAS